MRTVTNFFRWPTTRCLLTAGSKELKQCSLVNYRGFAQLSFFRSPALYSPPKDDSLNCGISHFFEGQDSIHSSLPNIMGERIYNLELLRVKIINIFAPYIFS